jgi:hypothetical protein
MMNHAITIGGLLLSTLAFAFFLAAAIGLLQWVSATLWPNSAGDDETVGPRGLRLFLIAGALCGLCIWGLFR